jgi:hypothetical protein
MKEHRFEVCKKCISGRNDQNEASESIDFRYIESDIKTGQRPENPPQYHIIRANLPDNQLDIKND